MKQHIGHQRFSGFTNCFFLLLAIVFWFFLGSGLAKADVLPAEIRDMVGGYFVFEEGYRNGDWELAEAEVLRMKDLFKRSERRIRDVATRAEERALVREIKDKLDQLEEGVLARDPKETHRVYVTLQLPMIAVIELFEYHQHPLVYFLLEELDERIEAIEAGEVNFDDLLDEAEEMEEALEALESMVGNTLDEQGLAQAMQLNKRLEQAATSQDAEKALSVLKEMQSLFEGIGAI